MEAHITFHETRADAVAKAGEFHKAGLQVALAGPVDDTFIRPDQKDTDMVVTGERWIVLATNGGLILLD